MLLSGTSRINEKGVLEIGGVSTEELANRYGTPLYVYDIALVKEKARSFLDAFQRLGVKGQVAYASKAFSTIAIIQLMAEEGLSLDVVSGGELHTAVTAGFPVERIHFHGNNKSYEELKMAAGAGIGCFVADNFYELDLIESIGREMGKKLPVMLRLTPGVEAHTHEYIITGQEDSKFGFDLQSGQADDAIRRVLDSEAFRLLGIHSHIGSQIFETTGFVMAIDKLYQAIERWKAEIGYVPEVLNVGGGFGIKYTSGDDPIPPGKYMEEIIGAIKEHSGRLGLELPEIWIEPGRAIVGEAGTTLYSTGSQKEVPGTRKYVAVDGGMSDNMRPALYDAKYEAIIANRAAEENKDLVSIAGKCCESGDMLIWDVKLPEVKPGDLIAVFSTGAYGYSMANNYNRLPRPAVVFVEDGESQLAVMRETYDDLIKLDVPLRKKAANR